MYVGCMIPTAENYDPTASFPGYCRMPIRGCMDPRAVNYRPDATVPDPFPGSPDGCVHLGCTYEDAFNYVSWKTHNDGSCVPKKRGCMDTAASNFKAFFNTDDGSCRLPGCSNPSATNYNANAAFDDGTCASRRRELEERRELQTVGCMDPAALNTCTSSCTHSNSACMFFLRYLWVFWELLLFFFDICLFYRNLSSSRN